MQAAMAAIHLRTIDLQNTASTGDTRTFEEVEEKTSHGCSRFLRNRHPAHGRLRRDAWLYAVKR
jgi:hypothetical protein